MTLPVITGLRSVARPIAESLTAGRGALVDEGRETDIAAHASGPGWRLGLALSIDHATTRLPTYMSLAAVLSLKQFLTIS